MIELLKKQLGVTEIPVKIELKNGSHRYGILIDYLEGVTQKISDWKFVSNDNLWRFRETENPRLVEELQESSIDVVDFCLK